MYKIGSLFSGIGGFELGLERAIPAETIWQVEQEKFCQSILKKHWPKAKIYDDVRNITKDNVGPVDILCGGFPCQDISIAGKTKGLKGEKSGLWWEMWRIISELRPRIIVLENVSNIIRLGGREVAGSLAQIGYDAEWTTIRASDFGAPHRRERWFCVAYPNSKSQPSRPKLSTPLEGISSHPKRFNGQVSIKGKHPSIQKFRSNGAEWNFWKEGPVESPLCHVDDGIPNRVARLKALGNAIVPQCSQWIGEQIWKSGILQGGEHV
jgi:DNA (cytosine-5)-methyltransferase 1